MNSMRLPRLLALLIGIASPSFSCATETPIAAPEDTKRQAHHAFVFAEGTYIIDHDRAKSEQRFLDVTRLDPTYAPAWFDLGVLSEEDRNWMKARDYFTRYLKTTTQPNGPDADRARKQVELLSTYARGTVSAAAERYAEYDATIDYARAYLARGKVREAIVEAGRAQALDKSRWEAYAVVSLCLARQHKVDDAVTFQQSAVAHAPEGSREAIQHALALQTADWNRR